MKNKHIRGLLARKPTHEELNASLHQSLLAGGGTKYGRRDATRVQLASELLMRNKNGPSGIWGGWVQAEVVGNERGVVTFKAADRFVKVNYAHIGYRVRHAAYPMEVPVLNFNLA
jgi:hypothetical protein